MLKKYIFLSLLFAVDALYCMDGDVKPFMLEEIQNFNIRQWGKQIEQEVKEAKEKDSFKALFADPICQRVLLSKETIGNVFCDRLYQWLQSDTLILSCERPYGEFWPAVKRMIGLSALLGFGTNYPNIAFLAQGVIDRRKEHALCIALHHDDIELAQFLLNREANPNAGDHRPTYMEARSVGMAKLLLDHGARYEGKTGDLLSTACSAQHASDLIPFYLGKGCPVNGNEGSTAYPPLVALAHDTEFHEEPEKVKAKFEALLQAGADLYNKGINGHYTALQILRVARESRKHNQASVKLGIKILEEAHEKLNAKK